MNIGLQMYSVRDITGDNLLSALDKVAEIGYKGIEFAGFFGCEAETVKARLDALGLEAWGTHTGWQELSEEKLSETIRYHQTIGCKTLIIPGADLSDQEKLDAFIEVLRRAQPLLAQAGITLAYHNHSHEFVDNADGSQIYEQLIQRTNIAFELDTYWVYRAGLDPLKLLDRLEHRLVSIHLKDGDADGNGFPLGLGTAPVQAVYQKAAAMKLPIVVESETLTPDGLTEARICFDYLKQIGAV